MVNAKAVRASGVGAQLATLAEAGVEFLDARTCEAARVRYWPPEVAAAFDP
jgi:hypothetical protein